MVKAMVKYSEIVKRRFVLVGFIIVLTSAVFYVRDAKVVKTHLTSEKFKSTGVKKRLTKIDESGLKKKQDRTLNYSY